jgi:hypothetical protein
MYRTPNNSKSREKISPEGSKGTLHPGFNPMIDTATDFARAAAPAVRRDRLNDVFKKRQFSFMESAALPHPGVK